MGEIEPGTGKAAQVGTPSAAKPVAATPPRYITLSASGIVDGAGLITMQFGQVPSGKLWFVERIVNRCYSTVAVAFALYRDDIQDRFILDATPSANNNVADEASPPFIDNGSPLIGQYSGCSATDVNGNPTLATCVLSIREEA